MDVASGAEFDTLTMSTFILKKLMCSPLGCGVSLKTGEQCLLESQKPEGTEQGILVFLAVLLKLSFIWTPQHLEGSGNEMWRNETLTSLPFTSGLGV